MRRAPQGDGPGSETRDKKRTRNCNWKVSIALIIIRAISAREIAHQGPCMELSNRQVITLFPSYLFVGKLPDLTLCDRLEAGLRAMKAASEASKQDELSFMTRDDIWKRREMKELVDIVLPESGKVLDFYKVKRDSHYITNMWGNITHPNHQQALHTHPNCLLSGIIYVSAPKDAGMTMWADPRPGARMLEPSFSEMNLHNMGRFSVAPE